jgi:hypothetical protein
MLRLSSTLAYQPLLGFIPAKKQVRDVTPVRLRVSSWLLDIDDEGGKKSKGFAMTGRRLRRHEGKNMVRPRGSVRHFPLTFPDEQDVPPLSSSYHHVAPNIALNEAEAAVSSSLYSAP